MIPFARGRGMLGRELALSREKTPAQQLAMRAKEFDLAIDPALTSSPPMMPVSGGSAACSRGSARLGVPGPESGRNPPTATLAGEGWRAPLPRPTAATPSQQARTMRCRPAGGTPRRSGPRRGLPSGQPRDRARGRAAESSDRSTRPASRKARWARVPLTGRTGAMGSDLRQTCCAATVSCPTPQRGELNLTAGTTVAGRIYAPLR